MRARQLAPFERQVLLLLVGCHISPPVLRTFINTKTGMDELSSSRITVRIGCCTICLQRCMLEGSQDSMRVYAAEQAWCMCMRAN